MNEKLPREKLLCFGPEVLCDEELLAIILRTGTKNKNVFLLSKELLDEYSLGKISRKNARELMRFKGISQVKASQIIAVFELARRLSIFERGELDKITNSQDVVDYCFEEFFQLSYEIVVVLFVDSKNRIIKMEKLSQGSLTTLSLDVRQLLKKSLEYDAYGLFLVHNHPSGDENPSNEDNEITQRLKKTCFDIGVILLDHIIIGDNYYSYFDNDML